MTEGEMQLRLIKSCIADLPSEAQTAIADAAARITAITEEAGDLGMIALSLVMGQLNESGKLG